MPISQNGDHRPGFAWPAFPGTAGPGDKLSCTLSIPLLPLSRLHPSSVAFCHHHCHPPLFLSWHQSSDWGINKVSPLESHLCCRSLGKSDRKCGPWVGPDIPANVKALFLQQLAQNRPPGQEASPSFALPHSWMLSRSPGPSAGFPSLVKSLFSFFVLFAFRFNGV